MKRILMFSGGIDSTLCLNLEEYHTALFVDYGQPAALIERRQAQELSWRRCEFRVVTVTAPGVGGLLGPITDKPESAVVPGRNSLFVGLAALCGAASVTLGCNGDDQAAFSDCRHAVLEPVAKACGVELRLPLCNMTKREVVVKARALGLHLDACVSCYRGQSPGCGTCAACILRAKAMA